MSSEPARAPRRSERVIERPLGGRLALVRVDGDVAELEHVFVVTETASFAWRRLDGATALAALAEELAAEFAVDVETAARDLASLIEDLTSEGLVEGVPSVASATPRGVAGELSGADETALVAALLREGIAVAFVAEGTSMFPAIRPGDRLVVAPCADTLRRNDVALVVAGGKLVAHRVVRVRNDGGTVVTRGDNRNAEDPPVGVGSVLGVVREVRRGGEPVAFARRRSFTRRLRGLARRAASWLRGSGSSSVSTI